MSTTVKVAVTQHEPIWFDLAATVEKTCHLIKEAADEGAKIIVFPEVWIPGYPAWIWYVHFFPSLLSPSSFDVLCKVLTENNNRARPVDPVLATRYIKGSLSYGSGEMRRIQRVAAEGGIAVVLGFSENEGDSLYISQCVIDAGGKVVMKRRKLKPTHMERTYYFLSSFLHARD
jgi:nitrilase